MTLGKPKEKEGAEGSDNQKLQQKSGKKEDGGKGRSSHYKKKLKRVFYGK